MAAPSYESSPFDPLVNPPHSEAGDLDSTPPFSDTHQRTKSGTQERRSTGTEEKEAKGSSNSEGLGSESDTPGHRIELNSDDSQNKVSKHSV